MKMKAVLNFTRWAKYASFAGTAICLVYAVDEWLWCCRLHALLWYALHAGLFAMIGGFFWVVSKEVRKVI